MTFTETQIDTFHRALHRACGLEPIRPSMADQRTWWEFLQHMEPLEESSGGPFKIDDLVMVLGVMRKANDQRDRAYRFTMRPAAILRDPERFRDMVLEERARNQRRQRPEPVIREVRAGSVSTMVEDPLPQPDEAEFQTGAAIFDEALKEMGVRK